MKKDNNKEILKDVPESEVLKEMNKLVGKFGTGVDLTNNQIAEIRRDLSVNLYNLTRIGGYLDVILKRKALLEVWMDSEKARSYKEALMAYGDSSTKAEKMYRSDKTFLAVHHKYLDYKDTVTRVKQNIIATKEVLNSMASAING